EKNQPRTPITTAAFHTVGIRRSVSRHVVVVAAPATIVSCAIVVPLLLRPPRRRTCPAHDRGARLGTPWAHHGGGMRPADGRARCRWHRTPAPRTGSAGTSRTGATAPATPA